MFQERKIQESFSGKDFSPQLSTGYSQISKEKSFLGGSKNPFVCLVTFTLVPGDAKTGMPEERTLLKNRTFLI